MDTFYCKNAVIEKEALTVNRTVKGLCKATKD